MKSPSKPATYLGVVLAYVLGSASLLLLVVFLFVGSFHFFRLGLDPAVGFAWNALLSAGFFVQHSWMVRRSFRRRLDRVIAEPFHGVIYTIASGTVLILCMALWQRIGEPLFQPEGPLAWCLRACFVLALAGFAWGVRALGSFDTFGVRPATAHLRGVQPERSPFLVKGPYRWVRHPLYFFALVLFWSCPVITPDRLLFNVVWTIWVVLATVLEERDLVSHFGADYVRYQREVPMLLPWRRPTRWSPGSDTEG